ncbi:MAG: glycerophosphodiester phosphodiesterase family protein [Lachnospiraceae bacterium]|nr:glycerophosphodiester phosphodiesterase family protein [Lachnospiraceae bacterium]
MTKILKQIGALACVVTVSVSFSITALAADKSVASNMTAVIHAGGVVNDEIGTNSLEALNNSFFNGYRYIELDFNFTTDRHLVCVHDWEKNYFGSDYNFNGAVSLEEFKNLKIEGKYTPLTIKSLEEWLMNKPNTYIITDIKEDNIAGLKYIKDNAPYMMRRLIPQIYTEAQYDTVRSMGYENIIYTLYMQNYSQKTNTSRIVSFAKNHDLVAITFSSELATNNYVSALKQSGTRLFVHTVNDKSDTERFKSMGIYGVYSDVFQ